MKIINLDSLKIKKVKKFRTETIVIDNVNLEDNLTNIYNCVTKEIEKSVKSLSLKTKPTLFQITVKFSAAKSDALDDIRSLTNIVLSCFNNVIVIPDFREREHRFGLSLLPEFKEINDSLLHIMKMINHKTLIDNFNVLICFEDSNNHSSNEEYFFWLVK